MGSRLCSTPVRFALVTALCAVAFNGCSSEGSTSSYSEDSSEYQLASLAKGSPATDAEVRPYELALDAAEPMCQEGRSLIGDMTFVAQGAAAEQSIETTTLELLRAIPESVPAELAPTLCADILTSIVILMMD